MTHLSSFGVSARSPAGALRRVRVGSRTALLLLGLAPLPSFAAEPAGETTKQNDSTAPAATAEPAPAGPAAPAAPPDAAAQTEAAERFKKGIGFYSEGDYALALIEFERAYQLVPNYRVLYNIGQVSIQLARFSRARRALERYLAEGAGELAPDRVSAVEADLSMLEARTAHLALDVTEGAEVLIDDESYGTTPLDAELLVDAGERRLTVRRDGYREHRERVVLAGAERLSLTIQLEKLPEVAPLPAAGTEPRSDRPPEADSKPTKSSPLPLIGWTTTAVLASAAVFTGVMGLTVKSDFDELMGTPDPSRSDLEDLSSSAQAWFVATDVLAISAVAAAGASLYFTLKKPATDATTAGVRLELLPSSVRISGRF